MCRVINDTSFFMSCVISGIIDDDSLFCNASYPNNSGGVVSLNVPCS